jgi:hypothetical protein
MLHKIIDFLGFSESETFPPKIAHAGLTFPDRFTMSGMPKLCLAVFCGNSFARLFLSGFPFTENEM